MAGIVQQWQRPAAVLMNMLLARSPDMQRAAAGERCPGSCCTLDSSRRVRHQAYGAIVADYCAGALAASAEVEGPKNKSRRAAAGTRS